MSMDLRSLRRAVVAVPSLALAMTGCAPRPNILLISIDSLRADHSDGVDGKLPLASVWGPDDLEAAWS